MKFIRKHGRIIPIKEKGDKEKFEGAALTSAGAASSVAGANYSGKLIQKARKLRSSSVVGGSNIQAANSVMPDLSSFGLRKGKFGNAVNAGGRFKQATGQLDLFEHAAGKKAAAYSIAQRVKAYKAAFRARKILTGSTLAANVLAGYGVSKLIKDDENSYKSEAAGVATTAGLQTLSSNVYKKTAHGSKINLSGLKEPLKNILKIFIKAKT